MARSEDAVGQAPVFDSLVEIFYTYPYVGVAAVFLFCGAGLPLPEEIVLVAAGFVCFKFPERAEPAVMMAACAVGILLGDMIPYGLGRVFGTRLLRLRYLRIWVSRRRLARFDSWFRRRGDLVIVIARFLTGIRIVAFFTAGTLKMPCKRFLVLNGLGIMVLVPPLVLVGYSGGEYIEEAVRRIREIERGILLTTAVGIAGVGTWFWLRRRKRVRLARAGAADTYVEPSVTPPQPLDQTTRPEHTTLESEER